MDVRNHKTYQILAIFLATFPSFIFAQVTGNICVGTDAAVCFGNTVTIEDCTNIGAIGNPVPYTLGVIPYNPDSFTGGTSISLTDDGQSSMINIGFDFCFYGTTYSQFIIGANNFITFTAAGSGTWITTPIPNTGLVPQNAVMGPWQDINPASGGNVSYQVYGLAPFRRLTVTWSNVPMFSCTTDLYSSQIILYETTNLIETHISNKPLCTGWNSGNAVHGLHGPGGIEAITVPGRNNTQWVTNNEGYRFTPQSVIEWGNTLGQSFPYNAGILPVTPTTPGPIGYFLQGSTCGSGAVGVSDTSWVSITSASVSASAIDEICSSGNGSVTASPISGTAPYIYDWPTLGATTQTVNGVSAGNYQVTITDFNGCIGSANITVFDTPAQFQGSTTEVSCQGGNDGTAFAEMLPILGNVTYQWDDPMMQTTQIATGLLAGNYSCVITSDIGCFDVINVTVSEVAALTGVISSQSDVSCNSANDGMIEIIVTQGTSPYSYSWDNSSSTSNMVNDLYVGTHTVTVTDSNGCTTSINGILNEPPSLSIDFLTPETQICPEDNILLSVNGSGGSSTHIFTWFENGNQIGTGDQIMVDPDFTQTEFCVELSELCGSPTDQQCTMINLPTPINPSATADEYEKCVPDTFYFYNTSTNSAEIASTFWEFGNFDNAIVNGSDPTSHFYDQIGFHTITISTTSIFGCVYTDTLENFIEVKASPTADFNFSDNPATIYETTIYMQDKSSVDVVDWQWTSIYSDPTNSTSSEPVFVFPEESGTYPVTLTVTTDQGCIDSITYLMNIVEDILFFAPNTFTPDGDEFNQYWKPEISGIDVYGFELTIFNRWGQVIWENHDPSVGWDGTFNGKIIQAGAYAWVAKVKSPYNDDKKVFTGSVSIIK
jgi:gliding motility-associated-like protein